jgi:hypothetical protein
VATRGPASTFTAMTDHELRRRERVWALLVLARGVEVSTTIQAWEASKHWRPLVNRRFLVVKP